MNEKLKMLAGDLYDSSESSLANERSYAKNLCYKFNNLAPQKTKEKQKIIRKLFNKTGSNFLIEPNFFCDYGYNIEIGENFYSNHNLVILDPAKVKFGDNVFIGPNCGFYTAEHPIKPEDRNKGLEYALPITVGNNVWIGGGVNVVGGVTIGDNVVIGAGSTVIKDIPPNCIAVGNPCKIIKNI